MELGRRVCKANTSCSFLLITGKGDRLKAIRLIQDTSSDGESIVHVNILRLDVVFIFLYLVMVLKLLLSCFAGELSASGQKLP